jgi:hypothetical protein
LAASATAIATLLAAAGGCVFAYVQYRERQADKIEQRRERRDEKIEQRRERREQQVFEALKWFEGKTQRRNIGIAVLEGYWEEVPTLRGVLVPLVVNQTIYLLTQSSQKEAQHERDNLERLISLLQRYGTLDEKFPDQHKRLSEALDARLNGAVEEGVWASTEELEGWKVQLV